MSVRLSTEVRKKPFRRPTLSRGVAFWAAAVAAKRWRVVSRGRGALAGLATPPSTHASVLPALRIQRLPWRLAPAAVLWESASHVMLRTAPEALRRAVETLTWEGAG
jgi:hypothetical protein